MERRNNSEKAISMAEYASTLAQESGKIRVVHITLKPNLKFFYLNIFGSYVKLVLR